MLSQLWESSTVIVFREQEQAHVTLRHSLLYLLLHSAPLLSKNRITNHNPLILIAPTCLF